MRDEKNSSGSGEYIKTRILKILKLVSTAFLDLLSMIRNIRIQTRLIGSFFILSLIPLLVTGIFSYYKSSNAMKSKISTYSIQIVDQVSKNIHRELARLEYDSVDIAISDVVQNTLGKYQLLGDFDKHNIQFVLQESVVKKFSFLHSVSDVLLYTNNTERIIAYGDNSMFTFSMEPDYLNNLLKTAKDKKGAPVWVGISKDNEVHLINRAEIANDRRYHHHMQEHQRPFGRKPDRIPVQRHTDRIHSYKDKREIHIGHLQGYRYRLRCRHLCHGFRGSRNI